jgi:uncharacterized protein YkwD
LLACVGVLATDATRASASSACAGANLHPSRVNVTAIDAATLCLVDQARVTNHLQALRANSELRAVAVSQVKAMIRLNYFANDSPSGKTAAALIMATRYGQRSRSLSAGENIGWGTGRYATPKQMVLAWMRSPSHREIILTGEFTDVGVGVMPAVPGSRAHSRHGATYVLELAGP